VIGVVGFVLLGTLVGTGALLNLLFKFTFVADDLAWHVYTYYVDCIIIISRLVRNRTHNLRTMPTDLFQIVIADQVLQYVVYSESNSFDGGC